VLELISRRVVERLSELPLIRDVDTSLESGDEEIWVRPQRERAQRAGLSAQAVAFTVNNALSGRAVSHFKTDEREVDIVMQYREDERETLDQLRNVPVFSADAALPLGALADFDRVAGPRSIARENHMQKVSVTANLTSSRASFGAMRAVSGILAEMPLPPGYSWSFGRWNRHQQQDQDRGLFALLFALPLVYMVLAALFESFTQPFTIMFSVPFALLGVGVAMKLAGQPWDNMTMLGLIVLLGVVVNNAIVLIDHINRLRSEGLGRTAAIIRGGQHRLRPIVITAVTTILGMMPLVAPFVLPQWFGTLEGRAANWAPIGLVIVGGLTTSTFLTLIIIPTIYSLVDDATRFVRRVVSAGSLVSLALLLIGATSLFGCGGRADGSHEGGRGAGAGHPGGMPAAVPAVPVEVTTVVRRDMSAYIETNGTLEAENEVDIVARSAGPIVELLAEEGMLVRKGRLLARLERDEVEAQLEISRVSLDETKLSYERAQQLSREDLLSTEEFERARAAYESARAQFEGNTIQLGYTEIKAPFTGLIIVRYVDFAQQVSANTPLFRISDFTPLLCPIQVPERELVQLRLEQRAYLTVEPFPGERFEADVLRISPVVDAATGTIKVTLEVDARDRLRPGMFARVFLETATREGTLVIPKAALSLESIGDTVYVAGADGAASRREVRLGFQEGDFVEVLAGVDENETVVVVGQDGLSDGTPVQILTANGNAVEPSTRAASAGGPAGHGEPGADGPGPGGRPRPDFADMTPEQLEQVKQRMRSRGMTDEQIEERIERLREGGAPNGHGGSRRP